MTSKGRYAVMAMADLALADKRAKRVAALVQSGSVSAADAEQESNARALAQSAIVTGNRFVPVTIA